MHIARKSLKSIGYAFGFILICTSSQTHRNQPATADHHAHDRTNLQRQAALQHYTSDRVYHVDYKGTGGPGLARCMFMPSSQPQAKNTSPSSPIRLEDDL